MVPPDDERPHRPWLEEGRKWLLSFVGERTSERRALESIPLWPEAGVMPVCRVSREKRRACHPSSLLGERPGAPV